MIGKAACLVIVLAVLTGYLYRFELWKRLDKQTVESSSGSSPSAQSSVANGDKIFTKNRLSMFDGVKSKKIYIGILGKVYDVTKGKKHYGPDAGYHGFAGRDGTRAFVSGEFNEAGLIEDVTGLTGSDILGLRDWQSMYENQYTYLGKLVGNFYDESGNPTGAMEQFKKDVQVAVKDKEKDVAFGQIYPQCNSKWTQAEGGSVWCADKSGGVSRDWAGVPRKYFKAGQTHQPCVCVRTTGAPGNDPEATNHRNRGDLDNPQFKVYGGCQPLANHCKIITKT